MNISDFVAQTTVAHVSFVAANMRQADRAEVAAATGRDPYEVLMASAMMSETIMTLVSSKGDPVAILGVVKWDDSGTGLVWMLGTDGLETNFRPFLRYSRVVTEWLNTKYPVLFNLIDTRNTVHKRWLKWCGFTFIKAHPHHGVERREFIEFVRIPNV